MYFDNLDDFVQGFNGEDFGGEEEEERELDNNNRYYGEIVDTDDENNLEINEFNNIDLSRGHGFNSDTEEDVNKYIKEILDEDIIQLNNIIDNAIQNKNVFININNLSINELPERMKQLEDIKFLTIIGCEITSLKNLPPNLVILNAKDNKVGTITSDNLPKSVRKVDLTNNYIDYVDLSSNEELFDITLTNNCLEDIKSLPPNLKTINLADNMLTKINNKYFGDKVVKVNVSNNSIKDVDIKNTNITTINLSNNPINKITSLPEKLQHLIISDTNIKDTNEINKLTDLRMLNISNTEITNIDDLQDNIVVLFMNNLKLHHNKNKGEIKRLPINLRKITAESSGIKKFSFEVFPNNLVDINFSDNEIKILPKVSDTARILELSSNYLEKIENIPENINVLDITNNDKLLLTDEQLKIISSLKNRLNARINIDGDSDSNDDSDNDNDYHNDGGISNMLNFNMSNHSQFPQFNMFNRHRPDNRLSLLTRADGFIPSRHRTRSIKHQYIINV
jgi:hypothetical protein